MIMAEVATTNTLTSQPPPQQTITPREGGTYEQIDQIGKGESGLLVLLEISLLMFSTIDDLLTWLMVKRSTNEQIDQIGKGESGMRCRPFMLS
jgi:hypothetical protein